MFLSRAPIVAEPEVPAADYYISPTGSDAANGLTPETAWLTPNHSVAAGTIIEAVAGTYSAGNFANGDWGTVTGAGPGAQFAILRAASPLGSCTITSTGDCIRVDKSNWAVVGWVCENTTDAGAPFACTPSSAANIHHVAFVNCVALGGYRNGFSFFSYPSDQHYGSDYIAVVGCVAYDCAKGSTFCHSGISIYQPVLHDAAEGPHIYIAGNFAIANITPQGGGCGGGINSDGNGIILDDFSHSQHGTPTAYAGTCVVENNICVGNGWAGITMFLNSAAPTVVRNNTIWGNLESVVNDEFYVGELMQNTITATYDAYDNIAQADKANAGENPYPAYGCYVGLSNGNLDIAGNVFFGVGGNNKSSDSSPGFSYGTNTEQDPGFAAPAVPGEPAPTDEATTVELMATLIANFVASLPAAAGKGYQPHGGTASDLFPDWLAGVVPAGLVALPA